MTRPTADSDNPLLAEWPGPFGGVPPFDRVRVEHFLPALGTSIDGLLDDVRRIASNPDPPTFTNTVDAFEHAGRVLDRVRAIASVWRSTMADADLRAIESEMMVRIAETDDRVMQDSALFRRFRAVNDEVDRAELTPEQRRVLWLHYTEFVRSGAALDPHGKERLAAINRRLAELSTRFDQNVLADEENHFVLIESEDDLAGLPESDREAAASAADARGFPGRWLIPNTRSAVEPFLTHAERRNLREQVWRMFVSRGDSPGENDNKPVITEILALRAERANLLGYATHAHWAVERQMAKTPDRALDLLQTVWPAAVDRVRDEIARMRTLPEVRRAGGEIRPWDYRFYAERVRARTVDLDWDEVRPYLQLEKLREGMFWVAGRLFGLEFVPVTLPVYHPDVRVWEVRDRGSESHLGLFYFDPFARPGKKSGAWMNHYRRQQALGGYVPPIVSNNCNYIPGRPDEPVLISWTDARTLFHEFGHALHGLLSDVTYPSVSGTSVPTDYVEFPSQLLESLLSNPEVLRRFALHHETGEPIPPSLAARVERAAVLGRAFATVEELASAIFDLRVHLAGAEVGDIAAFERRIVDEIGLPDEMVLRHRPPHFSHVFSGDYYAARYYSYLWADVLAADAAEAFLDAGDMFDEEVAARLREDVLSRGNTLDPELAFRAFRNRDPEIGPLMRKRGLDSLAGVGT